MSETELREALRAIVGCLDSEWMWLPHDSRHKLGDARKSARAALASIPAEPEQADDVRSAVETLNAAAQSGARLVHGPLQWELWMVDDSGAMTRRVFDLRLLPDVLARLASIPAEQSQADEVAGLGLSDEQAAILRKHLASRQQTVSEFFGDVLMDMGLGRVAGRDYPAATRLAPARDDTSGGDEMSETELREAPELGAVHDLGCRCWPHVSQRDFTEAVSAVGLAEYRDAKRMAAEARAGLDVERLREAARNVGMPHDVTVADIENLATEYARLAPARDEGLTFRPRFAHVGPHAADYDGGPLLSEACPACRELLGNARLVVRGFPDLDSRGEQIVRENAEIAGSNPATALFPARADTSGGAS